MVKKLALSLLVILFLISCVAVGRFESVVSEDLSCYVHTIKSEFTYVIYESPPTNQINAATSFHIGGGYVVTSAHCVVFNAMPVRTPFGVMQIPIKSYDYKYTMDGNLMKIIGTYDDVALLYNSALIGTPFVRFGDSRKLRPGDAIVNIGNSMVKGENFKDGMVSKIGIDMPILGNHKRTAPASMIISIPVNSGDSGSPVFAKRNGQHYLVAMVYANRSRLQGYNMAFMSNYIRTAIEEIRKAAT